MKIVKPKFFNGFAKMQVLQTSRAKLCIATSDGHIIIDKHDISHLSADSNYTSIHYNSDVLLCAQTMGILEGKINNPDFIRIHKSHVININHLSRIDTGFKMVTLTDGTELPIARARKQTLKNNIALHFGM